VGALAAIDAAGGLRGARLSVLCDVQTPFEDAARVFGPQKGADPAAVDRLSRRLGQVASRLPRDPRGRPGTGAAGGLSGALWAALDAELVTGIDTVLDMVGFGGLVEAADAVVTGEGCLDSQTAQGKVVAGVSRRAAKAGVPVWAVVGRSEVARSAMAAMGLVDVVEAGDPVALSRAAHHLTLALAHGRTAIRIDTSQRG
jgi:glycerate kinase